MSKSLVKIFFILLAVGICFGCSAQKSPPPQENKVTERIKLYYGDANNEKFVTEERDITYAEKEDKYKIALEALLKGPQNNNYRANIPSDVQIYGTIKQNSNLIVDFSQNFNRFSGSVAEIIGVGSVVNTLTQFQEIKRVKILVEGNELIGPSGQPRGFMESFSSEANQKEENPAKTKKEQVILYFGNKNADAVVKETRNIEIASNATREDIIRKILEELIKGPQRTDLVRTIPPEVKVKSVEIKDKIAYVDFSEEMHTKHWHGAAGESMTINSLVNTLTEFSDIKKVKMTVDGNPMNIEHTVLDQPIERNTKMIAQ
ncbi:MAG: GerMN domain-containing protein [Bacillota bacterium]